MSSEVEIRSQSLTPCWLFWWGKLQLKKEDARANEKRIKAEEAARLKAQMELFKPQQAQKVAFGVGTYL